MVQNWTTLLEEPGTGKYRLTMEWDHAHSSAVLVDYVEGNKVYNPIDDERCSGKSTKVAADGQPFWMPRFFPRPLSSDITAKTGFRFASADWQPCGHKDIVICHAESHYDFHLYYVDESELNAMPECKIGTASNPDLPVCQDSGSNAANHDYFKLINSSIPIKISTSQAGTDEQVEKNVDFCVDPTSAILRSGVHYGDKSETLNEWRTPVTIMGSHDCKLKFFEPMVSWNWISGCVRGDTPWPVFNVSEIIYSSKSIVALPTTWQVEVSPGCKAQDCLRKEPIGQCHIKITVEGEACPAEGCPEIRQECGEMPDCVTGKTYQSPLTTTATSTITARVPSITQTMTSTAPVTSKAASNTSADAAVSVTSKAASTTSADAAVPLTSTGAPTTSADATLPATSKGASTTSADAAMSQGILRHPISLLLSGVVYVAF
eukprot:TRINITY_DN75016_c0_g1_i1.p1 TRINITY_DN75016_c0_g1~~TRINITY_DN75016_c0_g1_i1.p1  ORF type:complete len:470 (+),score=68.00 TRINITY_DN75016_c0_g1_i1:112-1410(+)